MEGNDAPLMEMKGISKEFFGNQVLTDVNFTLHGGEILGLVGENGAGKSTLMKILFGMEEIWATGGYGGEMFMDGVPVSFSTPLDALKAGIGMVHQEFSLLPDFSATENILLNREPVKKSVLSEVFGNRMDALDRETMHKRALEAITKLGVQLAPDMLVSDMPVGHKQFTEIARELSKSTIKLLVLDEPTAVLTEQEADSLLTAIKRLSQAGIAVIFISHRLHEIIDICDTVMVMRDGRIIKAVPAAEASVQSLARWMVGREVAEANQKRKENHRAIHEQKNEPLMSIRNLWVDMPGETVRDVNLDVYPGEILGIGGLAGQGKLGLPNGVMGLYPAGGHVFFEGREIPLNKPRTFLDAGMAFVSEDRRGVGLLLDESLEWNIVFTAMQVQRKFLKKYLGGLVSWRDNEAIQKATRQYIDMLQIRTTGSKQKARQLSGGNQQKICLAKAFVLEPRLLFISEPTRGIDVGAKGLVLDALRADNEKNGTTIVMVSSELEELRAVCDRIAIVTDGRISGILPAETDSTEFGLLMVSHKDDGQGGAA
ncbi:sugar ABC transporter ATP-binding protein [Parasphaerochaeta coccoides]|uniref:Monosaccharide ABC transporter ATP-binding protein, CUT2 family n=1 Tax=Parasphaerochaeta coccoides (strain ATCC BAA-1237 / DSM 17374 / SPN1) TaxID=760011 RepID=F4GKI7_PARC1|nr:sugar ABC transporter ATP-binding protein [Parasphaerochaeta coccoides]AEC02870.1 monosaccharide ABC transporter ATP-binding protein, CUT2 family [Parasphaerochaeta coccoides DSM 17374]